MRNVVPVERPGTSGFAPLAPARTLSHRLSDEIRDAIVQGRLRAGQPLRQAQLAALFGVSPIPLREALRQLEADGFVTIEPYRGAVVAAASPEEGFETAQVSLALHGLALGLAFPRLDVATLDRAEAALCNRRWRDPGNLAALMEEMQQILFARAERPRLLGLIARLDANARRYIRLWAEVASQEPLGVNWHDVIERLRARDLAGALERMERLYLEAGRRLRAHLLDRRGAGPLTPPSPRPALLERGRVGRTLADRIAQRLREAIVRGTLLPGERLRQVELSAHFGVSAIPLREALRLLEGDGFVTLQPYHGAMVAPISCEEAHEIADIRSALEGLALRLSVPRLTEQSLLDAELYLERMEGERDPSKRAPLNLRFLLSLLAPCASPLLLELIAEFLSRGQRYYRLAMTASSQLPASTPTSRDVFDACRRRDVAAAVERNARSLAAVPLLVAHAIVAKA
jgi:DNA-binding GntR family transcriptional regulator